MKKELTKIAMDLAATEVREFDICDKKYEGMDSADLESMGISIDKEVLSNKHYAIDADPNPQTTPSVATPVQFAQYWLPNIIKIITRARSADKVVGRTIVGTWEVEQIVATIMERFGQPALYGDFTKAPLADWNVNFETRDNIRFEMGIATGKLEELRASQMRLNSMALKREAMAEAFDILHNNVAWFGYNGGGKKVYGLLTDPAITVDTSTIASITDASATFDSVKSDLQLVINDRIEALAGNYDPQVDTATLVLAPSSYAMLGALMNSYGLTVKKWFEETYPKVRIVTAAEFYGTSGNVSSTVSNKNILLFFVDKVMGDTVVQQMVTSNMRLVGTQPMAKGVYEVYSSSTAGALLRYPLAYGVYTE